MRQPWVLEDSDGSGAAGHVGVQSSPLSHHVALVSPGEPRGPSLSVSFCLWVPHYFVISDLGSGPSTWYMLLPVEKQPWSYRGFPGRWAAVIPHKVPRCILLTTQGSLIGMRVLVKTQETEEGKRIWIPEGLGVHCH